MEEAATPFPSEETTPPVTKIYFGAIHAARAWDFPVRRAYRPSQRMTYEQLSSEYGRVSNRRRGWGKEKIRTEEGKGNEPRDTAERAGRKRNFSWERGLDFRGAADLVAPQTSCAIEHRPGLRKPAEPLKTSKLLGHWSGPAAQIQVGASRRAAKSLDHGGVAMKPRNGLNLGGGLLAAALFCASFSPAQQRQTTSGKSPATYNMNRETTLTGKVLSYTPNSAVPPLGAHAEVQSLYGPVDVHLGSAKLLEQKSFVLKAGDSVRITGEVIAIGQSSTFAARVVENGDQSITVRNTQGRLILTTPVHAPRGVR